MCKKMTFGLMALFLMLHGGFSFSQSSDTVLSKSLADIKKNVDFLSKIKISGLIQFQYQLADTNGVKTFAGGDFPANSNNRVMVRRGRFKINYTGTYTQYVVQMQVSESEINLREAYFIVNAPWIKSLSLTTGIFFRPFGYDLEYSDASREAMERTRMVQTLFPGERDLGTMIRFAPTSGSLKFLNARIGIFAGNGVAKETDQFKDVIGRIGFHFPVGSSSLTIDGGISGYWGKLLKDKYYTDEVGMVARDTSGKLFTIKVPKETGASLYTYDESVHKFLKSDSAVALGIKRNYYGLDLQVNYLLAGVGQCSVRGEIIVGESPGTASSSKIYQAGNGNGYLRSINGYYIWLVQNIGKNLQVFGRYDVFDPNTKVEGLQIGMAGSGTSAADMKYTTLGFGAGYNLDQNLRFSVYYDMVTNELAPQLKGAFNRDLPDNVLTFRLQYKF